MLQFLCCDLAKFSTRQKILLLSGAAQKIETFYCVCIVDEKSILAEVILLVGRKFTEERRGRQEEYIKTSRVAVSDKLNETAPGVTAAVRAKNKNNFPWRVKQKQIHLNIIIITGGCSKLCGFGCCAGVRCVPASKKRLAHFVKQIFVARKQADGNLFTSKHGLQAT